MSIEFEYLYRDAGNNDLRELRISLKSVLIDQEFFVVSIARVSQLHFDTYDEELDHEWHEYHGLEETSEQITDSMGRDITDLMKALEKSRVAYEIP